MSTSPAMADAEPAAGELRMARPACRELALAAAAGYPHEVCGLLIGRTGDGATTVERIVEVPNLDRDRPHDRYRLDPAGWVAADRGARAAGLDVVGVWHTHPDHPAHPSATDLAAAWPDLSYLIVTTTMSGAVEARSWRLAEGGFREETLVLEDPQP